MLVARVEEDAEAEEKAEDVVLAKASGEVNRRVCEEECEKENGKVGTKKQTKD